MLVIGKILKKVNDYNNFLNELNITERQIQLLVNMDNVVETTSDLYHKSNSKIHGTGVFASKNIRKGEIIGDVSKDSKYRTTLGRWVNHSKDHNTKFRYKKDNVNMFAVADKDINVNEEILVNYRHHVNNTNILRVIQTIECFNN